jgi:hypothetical protein
MISGASFFCSNLPLICSGLLVGASLHDCTACGFWDTGLNPTRRWRPIEAASCGSLLGQ